MQKALFPMKYYNLTQGYINSGTHKGTYALDNAGKDKGKDAIFAPFDCKVTKIYVKSGNATTAWITSTSKVLCANGKQEYLTLMIVHPEDIVNLKIGQTFKQGQVVCHEGKTGNASGNHAHLELGIGTCGWHANSYGVWMIDNAVKLEDYLMLTSDAIVINDSYNGKKYSFKRENVVTAPVTSTNTNYVIKYTTSDLNERTGAGVNYPSVNVLLNKSAVKVYETVNGWSRIETGMWVSDKYLSTTKPSGHIMTMEVTKCSHLNVRTGAGTNCRAIKTIPCNTVVSVLAESKGWVKIGANQWVSKNYLK